MYNPHQDTSIQKRMPVNDNPGIFTQSDDLANEVVEASDIAGEKLWRLPMEESYWESMKSSVADMVNTGGRQGGSITAALFFKQKLSRRPPGMWGDRLEVQAPAWDRGGRLGSRKLILDFNSYSTGLPTALFLVDSYINLLERRFTITSNKDQVSIKEGARIED
ncbi:hypothetical protein AgCh_028774 [Apium graveolens]